MIFKAKNDWGNTGVRSGISGIGTFVDKIKSSFNPQQRFNEADTKAINNYVAEVERLKGLQASVENFNGSIKESIIYKKAFDNTMQDQSEEVQTFVRGLQNGTENLDNMTKASKAAELGMRGLALAGNMLASFLVSSFISLLINVANASDEIADSAAQIGNSFKETTSDLDDYKTKVDELRNTIDDSSSSIADVQNARKELISIQDDLIEKYGTEESVVKSITDAVNGEANAWDQLKKKKWTESRNDFNNNFSNGTLKGVGKSISNFFNGYQNNIDRMKKEYGDYSVDINTGSITGDKNRKQAEDILSKFGTLTKNANNSAVKQLTIKGNAEEVYNTLLNIQSVFNDINNNSIGKDSAFVTELGNMAEAADDVVQKYEDFWTEYVLNEEILSKGSKYTSDYKDIINDYNDYQKAVENGDKETVKATKQTLVESISGAMDEALKNGDDDVLSFFQNMYPDLKSEVESWRFDIDFEANTKGLEDKVKNPIKALEDFSSDELKSDVFDPNTATKEQKDAYNTLIGVATQYGLTIDELIEKLQKMGLLSSDFEKLYNKTLDRFEKAGSKSKKKNVDVAEDNLQNEYKKISDWGLDDYAEQIKNGTIQSKFGNVDMDKRTIIHWSDELKQTYKDELDSWDYNPEVGGIDTVFGGSERFGEDLNGKGWEVAFTPILPDGTFLSKDTVEKYISQILAEAYADDGKVTENELTKIDAEGMKVGNTFVHGIFAGIDDSEEYDNNGNWAEVVGRLMHFSGDSGAVSLAKKGIEKAKKLFGQDDQSKIEKFLKSEGLTSEDDIKYFNTVTSDATSAAEAIKMYNAAKKAKKETDSEDSSSQYGSFKEGWKALGNSTDDTFKDTQKDLEALAKAGELTQKTFNKVPGAKKWAKQFDALGMSTKDVIDRINKMQTASDQLSSMKSGISSISSVLAEKKDNTKHKKTRNVGIGADTLAGFDDTIKDLNSWKEFEKTLGNGKSSMADCQKVANKLATEWVNSNNFLSNLNETNQDYYKSTLREMGVVNADAVVHKAWVQIAKPEKEVKEELKNEGIELADATWKNVYSTETYSNASKEAKTSLQYLYAQENILANSDLGLQEKVNLLSEFIKKTLGAAEASKIASEAFHQVALAEEGGKDTLWYQKQYNKNYIDLYNKKMNKVNLGVKVTPNPVTSGSGGNSKKDKSNKDKSKDSKQEIDWIARKLEVLQKAIDTTSSKLQNLFSIKAKKNNINKQITETTALLNANRKAAKVYTAEANKVVIDKKNKKRDSQLKAKVRSGNYDITKYSSKTADKINKYQDLIDKARETQDAVQDNIASIHDLNQQKLDNITTWYDKLLEKIDAVTSKLQAKSDLTAKVRGMLGQAETGTKTEYTDTLKNQKSALKTSQTELKKYEAERKAQRKKLVNKNKSKRQTTKDSLKRSGLSKKAINKKLKKFDNKNGKQLADFDATTKSQSAQLKENVYSAMSEMLDTAQSLANIPLEKLSVTLDKLSTQFTVLENQASRATKEIENAGTGLDYYTRKSQEQIDNKSEAQYKARLAKETAVSSRDAAANKLRAKGIDPSTIKTASDLKKLSSKDTNAMYWASQYLAGVSAVNDATSQLSSVQEDYASTVSSVTDNIIDERNKLYENERSKEQEKHSNEEKKYDYTDSSLQDRLDTIDVKLRNAQTDTIDSYKDQFDKSFKEADRSADAFYGYKTMGYLDNQPAWVQKAWNQAYGFMQKGYNFNPETDDIADVYISSDILEAIKQAVQDGYLPSTEYENAVKYNANISDGNNQYQTYTNNKATYDYETLPNSFKEIFSTISNDADRTVSDIQRNIDAIENSLNNDLFTNKTDSYKKEADYYANQKQVYVDEGDALRKQLALAESKGLKQGSDTWNEMMDQIHTADDNAEKAAQSYTNAVVNAFNSIGDIADRKITEIGKSLSKLDTQMSLYETQGHFITSEFYNGQGDLYRQQKEAELKKVSDLQAELDADVSSGDIKEYSERWYEMKDKIDEASQSAAEFGVKVAEATKNAFDAVLSLGEKSREAISRMNDEADFYQDILGRDKTVNSKTGAFTENGVASISLSYEKMTNDMVLNNNIKRDIDKVKERYANGTNPDYGIEKYNEDMDNLLSQQREAIKNYYDEREAVMSLVQDGLQKQLDYLQKIVDKYKEAINEADDLRSYNKSVEDATKEITSLEKQLLALQGNDTEEGRANKQSVEKQLQDARQNLDDIEWDKHKSDVEEILDQLMEDAQDHVDEKIDQVVDSIDQIRDLLPENATQVSETLKGIDALWDTRISEHLADAVKLGDYSTINSHIDSAASTIAQGVHKDEKSTLENGSGNGTTGNAPDNKPPSQPSQNTKPITSFAHAPGSKIAADQAIKNFDPLKTKEGLRAVIKPYLLDGSMNTGNVMSTPRAGLDAMTYNSGDGTIFSDRLGLDGKIPDDNVPKLLTALGRSEATSADINTQVGYLMTELKNRIDNLGGFSKGGIVGALNNQVRKNNDDALISVQSGEGILTPQQTEMFQKLVGELPALVNIADVKVPNFPTTQNTSKTVNVELGDMHFDLPNVTDTDSFINAWKTDNKMKNFVSDVVTGAVTGDNSKAMRY